MALCEGGGVFVGRQMGSNELSERQRSWIKDCLNTGAWVVSSEGRAYFLCARGAHVKLVRDNTISHIKVGVPQMHALNTSFSRRFVCAECVCACVCCVCAALLLLMVLVVAFGRNNNNNNKKRKPQPSKLDAMMIFHTCFIRLTLAG